MQETEFLKFIPLVAIFTVLASQVMSYIYHRFISHSNIFLFSHATHKIHHDASLEDEHHANEDFLLLLFYYVLLILTPISFLYWRNIKNIRKYKYLIATFVVTSLLFIIYEWYIHRAYHVKDHWLNKFQWFRTDKNLHYIHHRNVRTNFGITSHFSDITGGTYVPVFKDETPDTLHKAKINKHLHKDSDPLDYLL